MLFVFAILVILSAPTTAQTEEQTFSGMDTDGDMELSVSELAAATGETEEAIRWWIRHQRADRDLDGKISASEAWRLDPDYDPREEATYRSPRPTFQDIDANGDGILTVHEIARMTGYTEAAVSQWLAQQGADMDGDGALSQQEADAMSAGRRGQPCPAAGEKEGGSWGFFLLGLWLGGLALPAWAWLGITTMLERSLALQLGAKCGGILWIFLLGWFVGGSGGAGSFGSGFVVGILCGTLCLVAWLVLEAKKSGAPITVHAVFGTLGSQPANAPMASTDQVSTFSPPVPIVLAQPMPPA